MSPPADKLALPVEDEREILRTAMVFPERQHTPGYSIELFSGDRRKIIAKAISACWEDDPAKRIDEGVLSARSGLSLDEVRKEFTGCYTLSPEAFELKVDKLNWIRGIRELRRELLDETALAEGTETVDPAAWDRIFGKVDVLRQQNNGGANADIYKIALTGDQRRAQDIKIEWTVDKLIPSRAITLLHASGGVGKTWFLLDLAKAVSEGASFLGLPTIKSPVFYIDLENPQAVLRDRLERLDIHGVLSWHLSDTPRPPKLDGPDWTAYKQLRSGTLAVFDTGRSFYDGKENDSDVAALVMNRLKEIRERGVTPVLLHHAPGRDPNASKGSTAWVDLADHVLAFHKVGRGTEEDDEGALDPETVFFLGTNRKTRFDPVKLNITRDPSSAGYILAESPDANAIDAISDYIAGEGCGKNQSEIINRAKETLGGGRREHYVTLLRRGEREGRWRSRPGPRGAKLYEPA